MRLIAALLAALLVPPVAYAAPPGQRDPNWPCQQIRVSDLSLAAIWAGPPVDVQKIDWRSDPEVANLVETIAPRREPLDQAKAKIHEFAQHLGEQKQSKLLALLAGLFTVLDQERSSVMAGLDRFGARQKQLAAEIRADNDKLWKQQSDPQADADAVNHLTEQIKWEFQVFQDRRQALSYACDVPSQIEQRLFALARDIQQELG